MHVRTVRGMGLSLQATNVCLNSVANTRLEAKIFQTPPDFNELLVDDTPVILYETEFQPVVRSRDQIVWSNPDKTATHTTEELAECLIDQFLRLLE